MEVITQFIIAIVATSVFSTQGMLTRTFTSPTHVVHKHLPQPKKFKKLLAKHAFKTVPLKQNGLLLPHSITISPSSFYHIFSFTMVKSKQTGKVKTPGFHFDEDNMLQNSGMITVAKEQVDPTTEVKSLDFIYAKQVPQLSEHPLTILVSNKTFFPGCWTMEQTFNAIEESLHHVDTVELYGRKKVITSSVGHMPIIHILYDNDLISSYPLLSTEHY